MEMQSAQAQSARQKPQEYVEMQSALQQPFFQPLNQSIGLQKPQSLADEVAYMAAEELFLLLHGLSSSAFCQIVVELRESQTLVELQENQTAGWESAKHG